MEITQVLLLASSLLITVVIIHFIFSKILTKIHLSKQRAKIVSSDALFSWITILIIVSSVYYGLLGKLDLLDLIFLNVICAIVAMFIAYIISLT